jgi:hypothetical protein
VSTNSQRQVPITRTVEIDAGLGRRIEVTVHGDGRGAREVLLRDLSFGPGLGWYPQRTIRLDAHQAEALLKALCCARQTFPCKQLRVEPVPLARKAGERDGNIVHLDPKRPASS